MGMTIDEAIYCMQSYLPSEEYTHCTECKYYGCNANRTCKSNEAHQKAISTMRKYQQLNADYETRLKADMVAMLEELKLEFEEYEPKWAENEDQVIVSDRTWEDFDDIIQQKIDALKEIENENN